VVSLIWYYPWRDISFEPVSIEDIQDLSFLCRSCGYGPLAPPTSSRRDAIIMMGTVWNTGIGRLVGSLRHSGCKAQIFIFGYEPFTLPEEVRACDVNVITFHPTERSIRSPYKIRWEWYYDFIKARRDKFDRIFHTDAYDAVVFEDPFNYAPDRKGLYFQMEDRTLRDCPYNKNWLLKCHYDMNRFQTLGRTIACSGSLLGGTAPFFNFIERMVTHPEWPSCWGHGFDQGDFNYILHTEFVNKTNWNLYMMNCNSGFLTMNYCYKDMPDVFFGENGEIMVPNQSRPASYVHQYNRYQRTADMIDMLCPAFTRSDTPIDRDMMNYE
jgi:hypothetical protein